MAMPDPTFLAAINSLAESIINQSLELDPASRQQLSQFDDQSCVLNITPVNLTLYIRFQTGKIRLSTAPHETQLQIKGAPIALGSLIKASDENSSPAQVLQKVAEENGTGKVELNGVEIDGDLKMAVAIREFLAQLELDWESALAEKIGDVPAHFIGVRLRKLLRWERGARDSLLMDIDEYVHEESRQLPSRQEHEQHQQAVTALHRQTSDLEARIDRISTLINTTPKE
jgi:ubiquinone biosynthesis protein UbiJ